jgi:hypothetical protein
VKFHPDEGYPILECAGIEWPIKKLDKTLVISFHRVDLFSWHYDVIVIHAPTCQDWVFDYKDEGWMNLLNWLEDSAPSVRARVDEFYGENFVLDYYDEVIWPKEGDLPIMPEIDVDSILPPLDEDGRYVMPNV